MVNQKIIHLFDHALVLNEHSPHKLLDKSLTSQFEKIIYLNQQPTCENLLLHFKDLLVPEFRDNPLLIYLKLEETPTSFAEWLYDDQQSF